MGVGSILPEILYIDVKPYPCEIMYVGKYLCNFSYKEVHQVFWWLQSKSEKHGNDEWIESGNRDLDCDGGGFLFLFYTVEKKCFQDEPGYLKELKPTSWRAPWVAMKYLWSWTTEGPLCDFRQITLLVYICQREFINSTPLKGIYED